MTPIALDANGFPLHGHREARDAAIRVGHDMLNELPESVYHFMPGDADWLFGQVILRYMSELVRVNHARSVARGVLHALPKPAVSPSAGE